MCIRDRSLTGRYLEEGLKDRALTRDLDWGIDVPKAGYENKKIYIWAENVLGYLSMSSLAAAAKGTSFDDLWKEGDVYKRQAHNYELVKSPCTVLCLDYRQNGIGSNSCGPQLMNQYQMCIRDRYCHPYKPAPVLPHPCSACGPLS